MVGVGCDVAAAIANVPHHGVGLNAVIDMINKVPKDSVRCPPVLYGIHSLPRTLHAAVRVWGEARVARLDGEERCNLEAMLVATLLPHTVTLERPIPRSDCIFSAPSQTHQC